MIFGEEAVIFHEEETQRGSTKGHGGATRCMNCYGAVYGGCRIRCPEVFMDDQYRRQTSITKVPGGATQ